MLTAVDPVAPPRTRWGVVWRSALALFLGVFPWLANVAAVAGPDGPELSRFEQVWFWAVDPAIGIGTLVLALTLVRRYPVPIGVAIAAVSVVSAVSFGPALLALASVATRRRWPEITIVAAVDLVAFTVGNPLYQRAQSGDPWWLQVAVLAVGIGMVIAVGVAVGQRRALVAGLRERIATADREQAARVEATRIAERNRIARDMHDVLAHRISLVAMHAAAVGYRTDLSEPERREAMRTIEENARLALTELRDVLGVLRDPSTVAGAPEPPQPRLGDVATLVDEGRSAGMRIDLVESMDTTAGEPPSLVVQTAYRVVREGLTNARKHAPDARVTVSLAGEPGDGLALRISNPASLRTERPALPGAGVGLIGLAERVTQVGGRISHDSRADGGFELAVWLPWAA